MSDLISRSALLAKIGNVRRVTEYDETGCGMEYSALPEWAVMLAPAVDAVSVVRCKDCENASGCISSFRVWCEEFDRPVALDGYCHLGAKMDGGAENA